MNKPLSQFTTKLGVARKVERSRIWIEGARLIAAGFTPGRYFSKEMRVDYALRPYLILTLLNDNDIVAEMPCKVSGKGDKPIIDITGELVRESFATFGHTHVEVTYYPGKIAIRGAEK